MHEGDDTPRKLLVVYFVLGWLSSLQNDAMNILFYCYWYHHQSIDRVFFVACRWNCNKAETCPVVVWYGGTTGTTLSGLLVVFVRLD